MKGDCRRCKELEPDGVSRPVVGNGLCRVHLSQPVLAEAIEAAVPTDPAAYEAWLSRDAGRYADPLFVAKQEKGRSYYFCDPDKLAPRLRQGYRHEGGTTARCGKNGNFELISIPTELAEVRRRVKGRAAHQELHGADSRSEAEAKVEGSLPGDLSMNIPGRKAAFHTERA